MRAMVRMSLACVVLSSPSCAAATGEPARASIRGDGTLLINEQPVFPIGIRIEGEGKEHAQIAEAGFNMLLGSGKVEAPYYEAAVRKKLWVIAGHYVWATFATIRSGNSLKVDLYAEDDASFQKTFGYWNQSGRKPLDALAAFDRFPCVFAWNTCEEPPAKFIEPIEHMYEIFKSNSPHHLVIPLSCNMQWAHVFRKAGDVLIVDCYPYRGHRSQPALYTYQWVRRAREAIGDKPVWLMPQLYQPFYWSRRDQDELTGKPMLLADAGAPQRKLENYEPMIRALRELPCCIGWHVCGAYLENRCRGYGFRDENNELVEPIVAAATQANLETLAWVQLSQDLSRGLPAPRCNASLGQPT